MSARCLALVLACLVALSIGTQATAAEKYAIVVSGASGEQKYAARYEEWRTRLVNVLADRFGFRRDRVFALGEKPAAPVQLASADNVRRTITTLARRTHPGDLLLVVLIGHGTFDGTSAKFNLVGPDLDAADWSALLRPIPGRLIVVNTAGASFPFLSALSARGRVVITATDSRAARYDTVFPEFFIKAMEQAAAEGGTDGRVSIWDVFTVASAGVTRYYAQRGLLPVEHAMLDDAGDGVGKEADRPGTDPSVAQGVYLNGEADAAASDPAALQLAARRDELMAQVEKLRARKTSMLQADYEAQLETLLVELARVSRELRGKG